MAGIPDETKETMRRWSETVGGASDIVKEAAQGALKPAAPIPHAAALRPEEETPGASLYSAVAIPLAGNSRQASGEALRRADR